MKNRLFCLWQVCLTTLCLALLVCAPVGAQTLPGRQINPKTVDLYLQDSVQKYHLNGLAVAMVKDGETVFMKGYGQAGSDRPVTPQTQFYLGSVTKSFTALAVMQLVEQGKIELDTPVQRYLPWFQVADAQASREITIRQLLNHTSGLSETADEGVTNYKTTLTEQIRAMHTARLTAPVGSQYQYDSQNYRTLGLVIETVSGQFYADYLRDHIFIPLGMQHTTADPHQAPQLAQGYGQFFGWPVAREQPFQPGALPSGYLISTAEDLAKFALCMLNEGRYNGGQLVQPVTLKTMMSPPQGINSEYGMGWMITKSADGHKLVLHGGALTNFSSMLMLIPEENAAYVMLCNQNGLIPMFTGLQNIKLGLADLAAGSPAPVGPSYDGLYVILSLIVAVELGSQIYRLARLPRWYAGLMQKQKKVIWRDILSDVLLPLILFLGIPPLLNVILGGSGDWMDAYDLLPDVTLWLLTSFSLSFIRGMLRFIIWFRQKTPALTISAG
ncbi:MAG: beta-lactamase family protein [Anaerolineae bacterium]|nr:beta-lactamase family protein [Anaerolineae bacterium]